jgi:hypothetical protein
MRTAALSLALLAAATLARAAPHLDPGAPPLATREAAQAENRTRPASVGAALQSDAERHLRASFDAADTGHRGTLSRDEALAGGFGWIANHFDAIDTAHAGRVSFDDVRRYLKLPDAGATSSAK